MASIHPSVSQWLSLKPAKRAYALMHSIDGRARPLTTTWYHLRPWSGRILTAHSFWHRVQNAALLQFHHIFCLNVARLMRRIAPKCHIIEATSLLLPRSLVGPIHSEPLTEHWQKPLAESFPNVKWFQPCIFVISSTIHLAVFVIADWVNHLIKHNL